MKLAEAMKLAGAPGVISDHPCTDARSSRLELFCYACGRNVDALREFHDCPVAGPGLPIWWGESRAWVSC